MSLLDVPLVQMALGLAFLYFAVALATMAINEGISQRLGLRAETLWRAVVNLLGSNKLADELYCHHLVGALSHDPDDEASKPSYIPGSIFSAALVDVLGLSDTQTWTPKAAQAALQAQNLPDGRQHALVAVAAQSKDLDEFKTKIASWFDSAMERANGWYKRKMRAWSLFVATLLVIVMNADTFNVAFILWTQPVARQQLAIQAAKVSGKLPDPTVDTLKTQALQGILGWHRPASDDPLSFPTDIWSFIVKLGGLAATVLLGALGAPFWFDVLNRFNSISSSGTKPPVKAAGS